MFNKEDLKEMLRKKNTKSCRAKVLDILRPHFSTPETIIRLNKLFNGNLEGFSEEMIGKIVQTLELRSNELRQEYTPNKKFIINRNNIVVKS